MEMEIWLRLMSVRGMNTRHCAKLCMQLLSAHDFSPRYLYALGVKESQVEQFFRVSGKEIDALASWLEQPSHHLLTYNHPAYPPLLGHITSPPLCLFIEGDKDVLSSPQFAVVGSRHHTPYGEQWGYYFCQSVASYPLTITSGLAVGIDGIAHRAALDAGGKTVAVLGSGLNHLYPSRHRDLAADIVAGGGALVSEFPLDMRPLPVNFPRRNRIISGLSLGVLVVEASLRSGSLVTARYALEQNREVFVLPGALGNPMTEGNHWLIQQGACLVTQPKDIFTQLHNGLRWFADIPNEEVPEIICSTQSERELPFADVLATVGDEVTPVDVVAERAGQPVPEVVNKLLDLELAGWIAAVPGGYVRIRRAGHVRRTHVLV
ncbi:Rossmann fold nucleotide-binding protein Smf possibly involved in DNA uptake [Dickeya aquatica]|uniref:Rossmann fold nucleotide-binding protein Smf possibly involved in DNA uptake n=2 Tax=Pectobacteriaceae TaxID=1903410 RepID=A0A375AFM4_9GAMM|nr:Rossmann fold nucleotide-binding protein Smf possibly involved in DNA uptake [Dickeya aquatica]